MDSIASDSLTPALVREVTDIVFGPTVAPMKCDVGFVFGGSNPDLWKTAAEAYHRGLARRFVLTGGSIPVGRRHPSWSDADTPEAAVLHRELVRLGVPVRAMICEDRSTNSLENVLFAIGVFDFSSVQRVLVVCKSYAAGRQIRTLRRHLPSGTALIPYPFDASGGDRPLVTRTTWTRQESTISYVLDQLRKIAVYGAAGDIEPLDGVSAELSALLGTLGVQCPCPR